MFEKFKNFFEKINPLNWIENFVIKRIAKKVVKALPSLKEKGLEIIETHAEEIFQKVKITIFNYLQEHKNDE